MKKVMALPALAALALALTAGTALANNSSRPFSGSYSGTSTLVTGDPSATCNPQNPTSTADLRCAFTTSGTLTATHLGSGTYTGTILLNWATYTSEHRCAAASGKITWTTANGDTLISNIGSGSTVCETNPSSKTHITTFYLTSASGSGRFEGGSWAITMSGTTVDTGSGTHADSGTLSGTISY